VILGGFTGCLPFFDDLELFSSLSQVNVYTFELLVYRRYEDLDRIANFVKQFGVSVLSVHGAKTLGDMFFTKEVHEIEVNQNAYEKNLRLATTIGAKIMVLHGWNYTKKKLDPRKLVQNWNELRDQTREARLELSIELVPSPSRKFSTAIFSAIDEELDPSVTLTLDTESAAWSGIFSEIFERIDRIGNVYVNDFDGRPMRPNGRRRYLKPGTGTIDFKMIFQALRQAGYHRAIVLETPHQTIEELNGTLAILGTLIEET